MCFILSSDPRDIFSSGIGFRGGIAEYFYGHPGLCLEYVRRRQYLSDLPLLQLALRHGTNKVKVLQLKASVSQCFCYLLHCGKDLLRLHFHTLCGYLRLILSCSGLTSF